MKQIKFKQLATLGLCCSLLMNSLGGVTAFAETVTSESSPTSESTKESTQKSESSKQAEATTETSQKVTEKIEKQEEVKEEKRAESQVEVEQEETKTSEVIQPHSVPVPTSGIGVRAGNVETVQQQISSLISSKSFTTANSIAMPAGKMGLNLVTDDKTLVNLEDFSLTANITTLLTSRTATSAQVTKRPASVSASSTGFDILMDATGTMSLNVAMRRIYLDDVTLKVPKYIANVVLNGDIVGTGSNTSSEWAFVSKATATKLNDTSYELGNYSDAPPVYNVSRLNSMYHYLNYMGNPSSSVVVYVIQNIPKSDYTLTLTNRKVTENFKDVNGTAIPAPTGFTQGKKTSITNNNYTFKQSGTLPETYKASNGKTYKFKGWYKGKTKPATLQITKTPSYMVSFDDNDDLNVVYEEMVEQTGTIPAVTYKFGFVNEKGALVAPSSFVMKTNLTTVMNETPKQVGTATGVNNGNLKYLTIPSQTLTYTPGVNPAFSGATDFRLTVPKYYKMPRVIPGAYYTGSRTAYPMATTRLRFTNSAIPDERLDVNGGRYALNKTSTAHSYRMSQSYWTIDSTQTYFSGVLSQAVTDNSSGLSQPNYYTTDDTMYYFLENRRITENFVDDTGAKITPPTGFIQGKQTVIESTQYTFTQSGTLPDTYQANGKTYKFKGWYKGETEPATLRTTKTPSYAMTYDDNDDLNVVYEETKAFEFPALTYQFGFVDESGQRVDASTIGLTYDNWYGEVFSNNAADTNISANWQTVSLEKGQVAPTKNNLKEIVYPAQSLEILSGRMSQYSAANLTFALPKYYEKMSVYNKNGTFDAAYPIPSVQNNNSTNPIVEGTDKTVSKWFELKKSGSQSFVFNQTAQGAPTDVQVPALLREMVSNPAITTTKGHYYTLDKPVYYYLTNRKVTENFVDATGTKITPPTGFTQGNQILMTSDTFKYTSAKALPASYSAGGKTYVFQGWYKGKTKPNTLTTSTTPTYNTTFDDNDDMTAVYKEASISANLTMRGAVDVIDNGGTMEYWEVLLKNTGEAPLTSIKIKPTTDWAAGISTPTELFILGTGQNTKARPITKEQWEAGFEIPLDSSLPVGGKLTINLIGTKVTGQPGQVLEAAVEVTGNFGSLKASDTVRIKDLDQEIKEPTGEGFISVPTFDFGQVGVASATKQHGLKKAADYYGNVTRNPYVRISKTQPNWSLTAQLSQPKSATDSLPTATRLLLGAAPVSSFSNYNQPTELKNTIGTTNAINLTANNAATSIIANQQFAGSDVYQLDFTFDNIKLEVPANQGTAGQQYQAAVTWNLVTGP